MAQVHWVLMNIRYLSESTCYITEQNHVHRIVDIMNNTVNQKKSSRI